MKTGAIVLFHLVLQGRRFVPGLINQPVFGQKHIVEDSVRLEALVVSVGQQRFTG